MLYVAYLDEFGHIGPYISPTHPQHNTSPVFGLAGVVLPASQIRNFATFFYKLKCDALAAELAASGTHPAKWEKKGSSLYTTKNFNKYGRQMKNVTNRLLSKIRSLGGYVFYVGLQKHNNIALHTPEMLYRSVLTEAIKRLDQETTVRHAKLMIILDEIDDNTRTHVVEASAIAMFGANPRKTLIEPPIQAESHLYQTLQSADWICSLVGRIACHAADNTGFSQFAWAETYFGDRLRNVSRRSSIRPLNP